MSKFDIHKWNNKRRLAALNEYSGEGPYKLKFQSPSIEDPLRTIYNRLTQLVNRNGTFRASTVAPTTDGAKEQFDFWVRAILKDAPILLLDEATSSLDAKTEEEINKALEKITKNKTTITVSHKLSNIVNFDQIILFNKGKVLECGKHKDLVKKSSLYRKLYKLNTNI